MKVKNFTRFCHFVSALLVIGGFSAILPSSALQAQANLEVVSITHTSSPLVPGTVESFSIVVTNNGPNGAADPTLLFLLYDLDFVMASYTGDADWNFYSSGGTFQRKGNMPNGTTETISFSVYIPSDAAFNSTGLAADAVYAQIQSNTNDPNFANNEAFTSLVSTATSTLTIDKKLLTPNVAPGGFALYEISVRNLGPSDIGGIAVTDLPGLNLTGSAVLSPNSFNLHIPANDSRSVFASVQVDPAAAVGASFSNTASIATGGAVGGAGTNTPPAISAAAPDTDGTGLVVNALPNADLEVVSVTHTSTPWVPGALESVEVTIRNNGTAAASGVSLLIDVLDTDEFLDTWLWPNTEWFSFTDGVIKRTNPMPAGATESFTFFYRSPANSGFLAGDPIGGIYAKVSAVNPDPNINNNFAAPNIDSRAEATLTLTKTLLTPTVAPGGTALYELTVCNNGPSDIRGIQLLDVPGANLDAGTLVLSADAASMSIAAGTCIDITASVRVSATATIGANFVNGASLSAATATGGAGTNLTPVVTLPSAVSNNIGVVGAALPAADVQVLDIRLTTGPIVPGTIETFEVDVINNGPSVAYGAIINDVVLNFNGTVVNGPTGPWLSQSNGNTFARSTPMPVGVTETIFFSVLADGNFHYYTNGAPINFAVITSSNPDPVAGNNGLSEFNLPTQAQAALTIDKTLLTPQVAQGGTALYEVTVCNNGPSDIDGIDILDVPGANLVAGSQVLGAAALGIYIPDGECRSALVSAQVSPSAVVGSNFSNTASVSLTNINDGPATNQAPVVNAPSDINSVGVVVAALPAADVEVVSVTHNTSPLVPGTTESFTITVRNNGPADAVGAQILYLLTDIDDVIDGGTFDADWFSPANGVLARTNPMPAGAVESFTIDLRIAANAHYTASDPIGPFYTQISASNTDINVANNFNLLNLDTRAEATLTLDKRLLSPQVAPGGTALYELTVCNNGPSDIRGIQVLDIPGANLDAGTLVLSADAANLTIEAGDCVEILASVRVSASAVVGSNFVNAASVSAATVLAGNGSTLPPVVTLPSAVSNNIGVVIDALPAADVAIIAIRHPNSPVVPGTVERFEVDIRNNGAAPAYGVVLNNLLLNLSGTVVGGPLGPWVSQSDGNSFARSTPMPANVTETVFFEIQIDGNAHYQTAGGPVYWATVTSSSPDPNVGNNTATLGLSSQLQATLTIDKKLLTPQVSQGGTALYEIEVCNQGPSDVWGVAVTDVLGANLVAGSLVLGPNADNLYIPADGCVVVTATATVDPAAIVGSNFGNTASVSNAALNDGWASLAPVINAPSDADNTGVVVDALPNADVQVVSVTHNSSPLVPGTNESFTIVVQNNGPATAYGVVLTFLLPQADYYLSAQGGNANWSFLANNLMVRTTPMPAGTTESLTFSIHLPSSAAFDAAFSISQVSSTIAASNPDPVPANNTILSNTIVTQAQATLTLDKRLLTPQVAPGGTAIYELTVCNNGPSDISGIQVLDVPGANLDAGTLVLSADAAGLTINAGDCVEVLASVRVSASAIVGSNFVNAASLSAANANGGTGTNQVPLVTLPAAVTNNIGVVIDALPAADVAIIAIRHPNSPVVPGTVERFEVDIRNNGAAPAYGVILNNLLLNLSGTVVNGPTGAWVSQADGNTFARSTPMPANVTETVFFEIQIDGNAHYQTAGGPVYWATVTSSSPDPNTGNNTATLGLSSQLQAVLTIDKKLLTPQVSQGGTAFYEIEVCNQGPSDVWGVAVTDVLGANLVAGSLVLGPNADNLYIPADGCVVVTATATVDPAAPVGSNFGNTASVSNAALNDGWASLAPVINAPSDADNTGVVIAALPAADVAITSVSLAGGGPLVPGSTVTFNITAINNGPADALGAHLSTLLFDAAYIRNNSSTPAGWNVAGSGGTWTRATAWPSGQSASFSIEVIIPSDAHYTAGLPIDDFRAMISASNPDPIIGNNTLTTFFDAQAVATLNIQKTLLTPTVAPGGTALYEITICNDGPSDIDGIALDEIPGLNLDASTTVISADAFSMYIPAGQCVDVMVSVQVDVTAVPGSTFENEACLDDENVVDGDGSTLPFDVNYGDGIFCDDATGDVIDVLPATDLQVLSLTHIGAPVVPGTSETFQIVVRNNGPTPAYGATVTLQFNDINWSVDNDATSPGWSFVGNGTWIRTTAMPSGEVATFTVDVAIPADAAYSSPDGLGPMWVAIAAANPDPIIGNNTANLFFDTQVQAELAIEKQLLTPEVAPGGTALFEITICNNGPSDIDGIGVNDIVGINLDGATLVLSPDAASMYIPAGQCVDVLAAVRVSDAAAVGATFCNVAEIDLTNVNGGSGSTLDPLVTTDPDSDEACGTVINYLPVADVDVDITSLTPNPVATGGLLSFSLAVTNNGPAPAEHVILHGLLLGTQYTIISNAVPSPWTLTSSGLTLSRSGSMPSGATETIFFVVQIPVCEEIGTKALYASVSAANPDPDLFNFDVLGFEVVDLTPPVIVCPPSITVGTDVDKCSAVVTYSIPVLFDDCAGESIDLTDGPASGGVFPLGTTIVTYTATDLGENETTCTFSVTVMDMQTPTAVCQDITIYLDANGNATIDPSDVDGGSSDNCQFDSPLELEISESSFDCDEVGDNNVTLTVTDAADNFSICVAEVTVVDSIKPTFTCPADVTVDGCNDLVPDVITGITDEDDNCAVASISQNPVAGLDFGQTNGNSVVITVTVTDVNGNIRTCEVDVIINDDDNPDFLNCPTSMIMIGNDPDQCSGKVNWQPPVAVDDCIPLPISAPGIPTPGTVVQTTGPLPGSIVAITCPPTPTTITYIATDGAGNTSSCTFQVMVVDTEKPEFDADITMPNDTVVNCHQIPSNCVYHGPLVCTPLTNSDVNDNCTSPQNLVITYTQVSTQCANQALCCFYDYDLTRTWKVTDCAGNMLIHVQEIEVQDTTKPVALCKNITVTLDKTGRVVITPADINNGSFDNCAAAQFLTYTISQSVFTCLHVGQNVVTLTVTDPCGNFSTCTAIVTVVEGIGMCTPAYTVVSSCLDNATNLDNGQFQDIITVKALAMQTWTLTANNGGLFTVTSPAPPAAGVAIPVGTAFTAGHLDGIDNDGDGTIDEADEMIYYTLRGRFTECVGYTITISNSTNFGNAVAATTSTISNKACYPTPYFINLDGPFCLSTPPFVILVGEYNNAAGTVGGFMVNGIPTNIFDAGALGEGFHTVMATFDAGSATQNLVINGVQVGGSMADALADPGCKQKITKVVQVTGTPTTVACNDLINISLDASCVAEVFPDMVLEGSYYCFDDYTVTLNYPAGTTQFVPPNRVDATHINKVITYTLSHIISGNMCWGTVKVEDKLEPILTCPDDLTLACSEPTNVAYTGNVGIQDCSNTTTQIDNVVVDNGDCGDPRQVITRTFIVTDAWGNQSSCTQVITVEPFDLTGVIFPADVTLNCEAVNSNPNASSPSGTGNPSINGASVTGSILCDAKINFTDTYYDGCEGTYTILRAWSVLSDCAPLGPNNPINHTQRIEVEDVGGPIFNCPADVTVSVDPFTCCATAALPDVLITEGCSNILDLEAKVTGIDPNTGNITTFTVPGSLADFPGNNYWNPDTLAVFLFTQCLPNNNTYLVRYTAADQCGNASFCEFDLTVMDLVPPAVSCDEFTQVSLGSNGRIIVNASTFDDGTYDNCCLDGFEVARMVDGPCDQDITDDDFAPTVEFCCEDLGDSITVVFRAYDCTGNTNDCMVQVYVDDKLKPVCSAPANVTVSCENFDPSLWAYGAATATDNCCVDTITTVVILTNFDTTCNRGTITRRFTAVDCAGQTSTCTQRIVVTYEQDYFVRFPNDKILYACDSSFFDQPTFFGEDCELLAVSYHDDLFTVVPDACYKIERTWTIINWCTFNPNLDCIYVPNPNPNVNVNSAQNLPGPVVSAPGTTGPWAPTVVRINPTDPQPTNFSTFWDANANCYSYKQIIKVIDNQDPVVTNCPDSTVQVCDLTPNDVLFWNEMYWWDNTIGLHDLCEAPTDLTITATDSCGGENVNIRYLLFLDLDQNSTMETVVSSTNLPGFNNVRFDNANTPNFGGGTSRAFDERAVAFNQKYGFALQTTVNVAAGTKTASVRWNTTQSPNTYVVPQLPYGTHKIKWIVEDGCGNETVCEYEFVVKDCKAPTVVCLNGLSANIMPTDMIVLWASDFLQYTEDNCTPTDQIKVAIRRKGAGTGFPTNPDGTPQTSVTFTCADLGTQFVELWGQDAAGNADYCETYIIVQDNAGNCSNSNLTVAGELQTMLQEGLQDAEVELNGSHPALPPINMFEQSVNDGSYMFGNALPVAANYTVTPTKDDDHLNGVSTFDLVLINKHILGIESFDSPYKIIAADANNSKSVTTFDIAEIRKLILGIYTELPNNTSWRFVDDAFAFQNPDNPFTPAFPESKSVAAIQANQLGDDFVAMKIGDVNGTAIANTLMSVEDRTNGTLLFDLEDRKVKAGETVTVNFTAAEKVTGYQFTLGLAGLEVVDIVPGAGMKAENFAVFADAITTSFDADVEGAFTVTFRAKQAGSLRNMLSVSSRITKSEAYSLGGDRLEVALRFNGKNVQGVGFELYQNQPNPWINRTIIGFYLPEATEVTLNVYDETGRLLFNQTGDFAKGHNAFTLDKALVNTTGVLYYQVSTSENSATMKMIQTK